MVPSWRRVFVYSFVAYVPLLVVALWLESIRVAILAFVAALAIGMVLNLILPSTARKAPKVIAPKVPKNK